MTPDLDRLRKFSLIVAVILISYAAAGVQPESGGKASFLGLPLVIQNPALLPIGLALASFYSLVRFCYYGVMLSNTPHRRRKDLFHKLHGQGGHGTYRGSVFLGPTTYSTTQSTRMRSDAQAQLEEIINAFPIVGKFRVSGKVEGYPTSDEDGEPGYAFYAEITIPRLSKFAALIQDIDYLAPIWLNFVALGLLWAK